MNYLNIFFLILSSISCNSQQKLIQNEFESNEILEKRILAEIEIINLYPFEEKLKISKDLIRLVCELGLKEKLLGHEVELATFNLLTNFENRESLNQKLLELYQKLDTKDYNDNHENYYRSWLHNNLNLIRNEKRHANHDEIDTILLKRFRDYHIDLKINPYIIQLGGLLGSERILAFLESQLSNPRFSKLDIELALARNKIGEYHDKLIDKYKFDPSIEPVEVLYSEELRTKYSRNKSALIYINSSVSYDELVNYLNSNLLVQTSHLAEGEKMYYRDQWLIQFLMGFAERTYIEQLTKKLGHFTLIRSEINFTSSDMDEAIKWLKENLYEKVKNYYYFY